MRKVTKAKERMALKDIMTKLRKCKDADKRMRWQIIYTVRADPREGATVARQLGCSQKLVSMAVSEFNRLGPESFAGEGSGYGRSNSHLSAEEEKEFLKPFMEKAGNGHVTTTAEIAGAFEERVEKKVPRSTVTRLLKRNGWRKTTPKPRHPSGSGEEREDFKKNFRTWCPA